MNEGRRFEDSINIHELMNLPQKELMAKMYIQTLKTNGTVSQNCQRITAIEEIIDKKANKSDLKDIKDEMKDKIGWKLMTALFGLLMLINLAFGLLQYFTGR